MLSTLLILADAEREDPAISTRPLAPPIFIAGLSRSGTTFLHGLLAEDPANRAPRTWEAIYPYPAHRAAGFGAGRWKVQLQLRIFTRQSVALRQHWRVMLRDAFWLANFCLKQGAIRS